MKKVTFLFLALAFVVFAACSSPKTPSSTVKNYLNYIQAGNYEAAVKCFQFDQEAEITEENLASLAEKMKSGYEESGKNDIAKIEILSEETIDENNAKVTAQLFYKDGTDETSTYTLQKDEKGDWKIVFDAK